MVLYILRHGIAEDRQPGRADAERHLTEEGRARMRQEADGMAALALRFDAIYSSPYPRALETAQIVQQKLKGEKVKPEAGLEAGALRLGVLQTLLESPMPSERILLVGHEPDLSLLVQQLTGAVIEMKKGGLACVETNRLEPGYGVLRWLLTPNHLVALGEKT